MDFSNKIIWITGASSGIGEAMAYAFSQKGAKLAISARNEEALNRVKNACAQPENVLVSPLDVADFDRVTLVANQILTHYGAIDILINNAGISQRAFIKDTSFSVDQRLMNVNFLGTVAVTKAVLPSMLERKSGQIVTISSILGKIGVPMRSSYCASKHAIQGYFDSLRAEVHKDNVQVIVICPGYVNTNVTINALTGDGSANSVKADSTAAGMSPEDFAQKALAAIANQKKEVLVGGKELLGHYIKRLSPSLFFRISRNLKVN